MHWRPLYIGLSEQQRSCHSSPWRRHPSELLWNVDGYLWFGRWFCFILATEVKLLTQHRWPTLQYSNIHTDLLLWVHLLHWIELTPYRRWALRWCPWRRPWLTVLLDSKVSLIVTRGPGCQVSGFKGMDMMAVWPWPINTHLVDEQMYLLALYTRVSDPGVGFVMGTIGTQFLPFLALTTALLCQHTLHCKPNKIALLRRI